jgi:hypothetical protein
MMLSSVFINNLSYIIIAPFLPIEFQSKGVDGDAMGVIFAAFPLALTAAALLLG